MDVLVELVRISDARRHQTLGSRDKHVERDRVHLLDDVVWYAITFRIPASWNLAVAARDQSGGLIDKVSDEQILEAYRLVARLEGIFCEPASAASIAGVAQLARQGMFKEGERIVCVLTGNGLKDPDQARLHGGQTTVVPADAAALTEVLSS